MTFEEYEHTAAITDTGQEFWYYGLGLAGESGEVVEVIKKWYRSIHRGEVADGNEFRDKLAFELGDTLWYLARLANHAGYTLEQIAAMNIDKLARRYSTDQVKS